MCVCVCVCVCCSVEEHKKHTGTNHTKGVRHTQYLNVAGTQPYNKMAVEVPSKYCHYYLHLFELNAVTWTYFLINCI